MRKYAALSVYVCNLISVCLGTKLMGISGITFSNYKYIIHIMQLDHNTYGEDF